MTEEEQSLFHKGRAYQRMRSGGAYQYLLDFFKEFCDEALHELEQASDELPAEMVVRRVLKFQMREKLFQDFQDEIEKTLSAYEQWIEENLPPEEVEKMKLLEELKDGRGTEIPGRDDA